VITLDVMHARFTGLDPDDLRRWIAEGLVRPEAKEGELRFEEIDAERVRLILDLRDLLEVNETALPVVLSLLDQVYALRRRLRQLEPRSSGDDA
jgi:chaperone modulatory protein CbpM